MLRLRQALMLIEARIGAALAALAAGGGPCGNTAGRAHLWAGRHAVELRGAGRKLGIAAPPAP
jgi:hypothetical protein